MLGAIIPGGQVAALDGRQTSDLGQHGILVVEPGMDGNMVLAQLHLDAEPLGMGTHRTDAMRLPRTMPACQLNIVYRMIVK